MKKIYQSIAILLCMFCSNCAENIDFDQVSTYSLTPALTFSFTSFTLETSSLIDVETGLVIETLSDFSRINFFQNEIARDNLVQIDFDADISNELNVVFDIEVSFLDQNNYSIYQLEPFRVPSNRENITWQDSLNLKEDPIIKNTSLIKVDIKIVDVLEVLDPSSLKEFTFKSSLTLYIEKGL